MAHWLSGSATVPTASHSSVSTVKARTGGPPVRRPPRRSKSGPGEAAGHPDQVRAKRRVDQARGEGAGRPDQVRAKRSVASIRWCRMPGSVYAWPASSTRWNSASGHALVQVPGGRRGRADVVAALHDHARDVPDLVDVAEELVVLQEPAVDEVVVLDPRERHRVVVALVLADVVLVGQQRDGRRPPTRSRPWPPATRTAGSGSLSREWNAAIRSSRSSSGIGATNSSHRSGNSSEAPSW